MSSIEENKLKGGNRRGKITTMLKKVKLSRWAWIGIPFFVLILLPLLFGKNYRLNRTVREISMRLVQIEILSRTTASDYKVEFSRDFYTVKVYNRSSEQWEKHIEGSYSSGVTTEPLEIEFYFARGRFIGYQFKNRERKLPRSVIIYFQKHNSEKKKSIIFFRDGDWKVIG